MLSLVLIHIRYLAVHAIVNEIRNFVFCETREISWTSKQLKVSQVLPRMTKVTVFVTCWPRSSSYRIEHVGSNNHRNFLLFQKFVLLL